MDKIFNNILGEVIYNKKLEWYEGTVKWCGNDVNFSLNIDNSDISLLSELVSTADEIIGNQQKWDVIVRKYAAKWLTELANDWAYDDYDEDEAEEPPEITEEEFASRIDLCEISFYEDGRFIFWFYDDDMFAGHSVTVYGDIKNGCNDANIEG